MPADIRYLLGAAIIVAALALAGLLFRRARHNGSLDTARRRRDAHYEAAIRKRESGEP